VKPAIFKDKATQERFDRDGYVVIDFISPADASTIAEKFYELHGDLPKGFYSAAFNPDDEFKQEIFAHTEKIFQNVVDEKFKDFKKLGSTFLCKAPGEIGKVAVHQDWTVVDESKYYSATIWVPTVDTTAENGALRVLPGSHLFFDAYRGPNIPFCYKGKEELVWENMITVPMKAGQAFVLNHAVIHGSSSNTTDKERLAIAYGLIPKEASLMYYHKDAKGESDKVEKFDMPDDFFQRYYNVGERPLFGKVVEEFNYPAPVASSLKITHLIEQEKRKRKMLPLFKDEQLQRSFDKNGYATIPVLSQDEVKELLDFYKANGFNDEAGFGFHISMDQKDKGLVKNILNKLFEVAVPKLEAHFQNAKPFVGSFVIKEPNPKGVVPVHQDWTFVEDEEQHCSVTCWIPLVDTTIDNGAMGVINGSHTYFKNFRPSPSPQVPSPISEHMFTIFPYLQVVEMKAGEALVFDNRTFHGSAPNTTDKPRIAFGIGFTHKEAKLVHYYLKPDGNNHTVLKYKIDPDFFLKYENSRLAKMFDKKELIEGYEVEAEVSYILPKFTADELIEMIKSTGNEFNVPLCEKLAKLFSYNMDGSKKDESPTEEVAPAPEVSAPVEEKPWVWDDRRSFLQKYTPRNIVREVKKKIFA
jgi:ectoine hydroxylase-related dioxygenase (phytanoyl-CoA dioxygenase family)